MVSRWTSMCLPISNPDPDLHNINAHIKFRENPLMFTQVIIRKQKNRLTDVRLTDGWTDLRVSIYVKYDQSIPFLTLDLISINVFKAILMSTLNIQLLCRRLIDFPELAILASRPGAMINLHWLKLPMA